MDDYIGVTAICGDEGTGKTSMALTFPKPMFHMDIDVGGYRRAGWRQEGLRVKTCEMDEKLDGIDWSQYDIVSKPYPKPIQMDRLLGVQKDEASTRISIPKRVEGMQELWQDIVTDFVAVCQMQAVRSIIADSATQLYNICHKAHLQGLQDIQVYKWKGSTPFNENEYRERLQPMEYGPAFDRMRTIFHTARTYHKELVLTHYPTDEYGVVPDGKGNMVEGKTGKVVLDGFKETGKLADIVMWLSIKDLSGKKQPWAKITKCGIEGMGLNAVGMEIGGTFEDLVNRRNTMRGTPSKESV